MDNHKVSRVIAGKVPGLPQWKHLFFNRPTRPIAEPLTYHRRDGTIIEEGERIGRNEIVFIQFTSTLGRKVGAVALPQLYSCPSSVSCRIDCETPPRSDIICTAEYFNRALHNYDVFGRHTTQDVVDGTGDAPGLVAQVAEFSKNYKHFLWNLTGEIQSGFYLEKMIDVAKANPETQYVCRTRLARLISQRTSMYGALGVIPKNLKIVIVSPTALSNPNIFDDIGFEN